MYGAATLSHTWLCLNKDTSVTKSSTVYKIRSIPTSSEKLPSYPLSQKGEQQQIWARSPRVFYRWNSHSARPTELKTWYRKSPEDFCKLFIVDSFLQIACYEAQDFKKPSILCDSDISLVIEYIGYRIVDTPNDLILMQVIFIIWVYICKGQSVPLQENHRVSWVERNPTRAIEV